MKAIVVFALMLVTVTAENERRHNKEKRSDSTKDILSEASCRYLKTHGYLDKDANWRKLCLKTYNCKDVFSTQSCNIAKGRNECSKNSTISLVYCQLTCNTCSSTSSCVKSVPLGMESKAIPDYNITASSFTWSSYAPRHARLNHKTGGGWAPKQNDGKEWLQVDLGDTQLITGIATQGSAKSQEWVTSYAIQYSSNGPYNFKPYQSGKVLMGNTDSNTVVKKDLKPFVAQFIRVFPKGVKSWAVLRLELYGCKN